MNDVAVKNNDAARRNYLSSNRWDGAKEILLTEARLELLRDYKRLVRQYEKSDTEHWGCRIYEQRRKTEDELDN